MIDLTIKDLEKIKQGYDPVASRSWSLNAMAYIDPRIVPLEKCAIFDKTWQFAAHIEKLRAPGQYITIDVCGQSIVVLRDSKNVLRAFFNVCKHRGHELLRGEGLKKLIVCPYHAWSYTLEGKLKTARLAEDVENLNPDEICLTEVRVEEFCSLVFVNLDPSALSGSDNTRENYRSLSSSSPEFYR